MTNDTVIKALYKGDEMFPRECKKKEKKRVASPDLNPTDTNTEGKVRGREDPRGNQGRIAGKADEKPE